MIGDALDAFADVFSPPFRRVMWKSLGLTAALLILAAVGLGRLALSLAHV
jgi:CysZ protein